MFSDIRVFIISVNPTKNEAFYHLFHPWWLTSRTKGAECYPTCPLFIHNRRNLYLRKSYAHAPIWKSSMKTDYKIRSSKTLKYRLFSFSSWVHTKWKLVVKQNWFWKYNVRNYKIKNFSLFISMTIHNLFTAFICGLHKWSHVAITRCGPITTSVKLDRKTETSFLSCFMSSFLRPHF